MPNSAMTVPEVFTIIYHVDKFDWRAGMWAIINACDDSDHLQTLVADLATVRDYLISDASRRNVIDMPSFKGDGGHSMMIVSFEGIRVDAQSPPPAFIDALLNLRAIKALDPSGIHVGLESGMRSVMRSVAKQHGFEFTN